MGFVFFDMLFFIVPIIVILVFVFTFAMMFSPKLRAHFMGKQVKAVNYMMSDNREELKNISDIGIDVSKDAVRQTANAIKQGFTGSESGYQRTVFCSECGAVIEADSKFCKSCGKRQRKTGDEEIL